MLAPLQTAAQPADPLAFGPVDATFLHMLRVAKQMKTIGEDGEAEHPYSDFILNFGEATCYG